MMWLKNKLFGTRWVIFNGNLMEVNKCESGWVGFTYPYIKQGAVKFNPDGTTGSGGEWQPYYGW